MSGTYPALPIFASVGFKSVYYNLSSQSLSGRTQVRNIGGQRFEFSASYSRLLRSEFTPVLAFVMSQRGMAETFSIVLPEISSTSGTATGTVRTNGTSPIGDKTIAIDGLTGLLKAGDVIKFATHSKVYMVTQDRSGAGDLSIEPGLEAAVPNDTVITYNDVPFLVRLNNDIQEYNIGSASLVDFDVDFIESV
tara:strand:+ start:1224 stop:1802 length:579 start_codon:yes stop_codon:yes gene_type:complete